MLREKLRNRKGFTLIEIIVVIVILAVLMAVAVPSVMSYMNEGSKARYESVARSVLVRAQTDVAKAVSKGTLPGSYTDGADVAAVEYDDSTTIKTDLEKHHYGDSTVTDVAVHLSNRGAGDYDVKSVTCKIKLSDSDTTTKTATITTNKNVEIS